MKKQYLIGLLGLIAVSIPLGNSLLESNKQVTPITQSSDSTVYSNQNSTEMSITEQSYNVSTNGEETIDPSCTSITLGEVTETTAEVSYIINQGEDENGEPYEIASVEWVDQHGVTFGGDNINYGNDAEGSFKATDLEAKHTYYTYLIVTFVNEDIKIYSNESKVPNINTDEHEIVDVSITPTIGKITEDTATISYVIYPGEDSYNKPYKIESVEWVGDDNNAFGGTKPNTDGKTTGSFKATGLTPDETYDTKLNVTFTDKTQNIEGQEVEQIATTAHPISSPTVTTKNGDVTETTAAISYTIDAGKDSHDKPYEIESVEWVGEDGELFGGAAANDGNKTTGNFEATGLTPDETYDTKLNVTFTDETQNIEEQEVEQIATTAHPISSPTVTTKNGDVTETTAAISYTIDAGKDSHDKPYEIESVEWVGEDGELFGGAAANDGNKTTGNFEATGLTPDETYNTKLNVTFTDETQNIEEQEVEQIATTAHPISSPTVTTKNGDVTETTAAISYTIDAGKDSHDKPYEIESVEWVGEDGELFGGAAANDGNKTTGKFTATGLTPDETYNTKLNVTFADENQNIKEQAVDPIITVPHGVKVPTIEPTIGTIEEGTITDTTATISYKIDPGEDNHNKPYEIESVKWVDGDGELFGGTTANDGSLNGKFTATGLDPKTPYNTKLIISFTNSDGDKQPDVEKEITEFTTDAIEPISPTANVESTEITETTATFKYKIDPGKDSYGEEYTLSKVEIVDEHNGIALEYNDEQGEIPLSGELTLEDLNPNVKYDLTVTYTYANSEGELKDPVDQSIPFKTLKDGLGIWAIIGIIVGCLFLILLIILAIKYLNDKYNESQQQKEIEKEFKQEQIK